MVNKVPGMYLFLIEPLYVIKDQHCEGELIKTWTSCQHLACYNLQCAM